MEGGKGVRRPGCAKGPPTWEEVGSGGISTWAGGRSQCCPAWQERKGEETLMPNSEDTPSGPKLENRTGGRSREPAASGRADPAEARLSASNTALLQGYRRSVPSCSTGPERPPWPSTRNSRDGGREGAELGQQRIEAPEGGGEPRAAATSTQGEAGAPAWCPSPG